MERSTSDGDTNTDAKKPKTDDEMETDQAEPTDPTDWNSDAIKHSTIRILADKDDQQLSQEDIQHINRRLMRATFQECKGDMQKWKQLQPDKMSLMPPYYVIRLRLPSKEGVEFWRNFIPNVPPKTEGGYKYRFLAPGENLTEKVCFFVPDVSMAENKQEDLDMLEFTIRAGNEKLEKVPFRIRCNRIERNTYKAIMIMDIPTQDRLRCLGPKPEDPDKDPDWKIRIGISTVKVTVAFNRSAKLRRETAQNRLNNKEDQATTSPKPSTSKGTESKDDDKDDEVMEDTTTKVLEDDDEDIDGIRELNQVLIEDIGAEGDKTDLDLD